MTPADLKEKNVDTINQIESQQPQINEQSNGSQLETPEMQSLRQCMEDRFDNVDRQLAGLREDMQNYSREDREYKERMFTEIRQTLNQQGQMLNQQGQMLNQQGQMLNQQGQMLNQQGQMLNQRGQMLNQRGQRLDNVVQTLNNVVQMQIQQGERIEHIDHMQEQMLGLLRGIVARLGNAQQ